MMRPGHTHEDIDAMFRHVADALRSKGLVRTIDDFVDAARNAYSEQHVHVEHVAAVHDYVNWYKPHLGNITLITTARYFVIALRESDGQAVLWYKAYAGHEHLYPTVKDRTTRMPTFDMEEGVKKYHTCPYGIEVLTELPEGEPGIQKYEEERLDPSTMHDVVKQIYEAHPLVFGEAAMRWWDEWASSTPTSAGAAEEMYPMTFEWPRKSAEWKAPTLSGLRSEYSETVTYLNSAGGQAFTSQDAAQAEAEECADCPVLCVGDLLVMKPESDNRMHRLPFWVAEVAKEVESNVDDIEIIWRSAFKNGIAQDDVHGQWLQICKGSSVVRGGCVRYHPYTSKCRVGNREIAGHGQMKDTVQRAQVALYFAKLTGKHSRMYAD